MRLITLLGACALIAVISTVDAQDGPAAVTIVPPAEVPARDEISISALKQLDTSAYPSRSELANRVNIFNDYEDAAPLSAATQKQKESGTRPKKKKETAPQSQKEKSRIELQRKLKTQSKKAANDMKTKKKTYKNSEAKKEKHSKEGEKSHQHKGKKSRRHVKHNASVQKVRSRHQKREQHHHHVVKNNQSHHQRQFQAADTPSNAPQAESAQKQLRAQWGGGEKHHDHQNHDDEGCIVYETIKVVPTCKPTPVVCNIGPETCTDSIE